MANNPFSFSDPDGDDFGLSILIGVGIGILSNGLHNVSNGGSFFDNWGRAAFFGGVSGALGFGIGEIFGHGVGSFGLEVGRAAAHGIVSGGLSYAQGGDFWQGFASGAIGSGVGSGIGAWGKAADWSRSGTNFAMIGGGALSGGIGSSISGGSFWKGFGIAATVNLTNHIVHSVVRDIRIRHRYRAIYQGDDPSCLLACGANITGMSLRNFQREFLKAGYPIYNDGVLIGDFVTFMDVNMGFEMHVVENLPNLVNKVGKGAHVLGVLEQDGGHHAVMISRIREFANGRFEVRFMDSAIPGRGRIWFDNYNQLYNHFHFGVFLR